MTDSDIVDVFRCYKGGYIAIKCIDDKFRWYNSNVVTQRLDMCLTKDQKEVILHSGFFYPVNNNHNETFYNIF